MKKIIIIIIIIIAVWAFIRFVIGGPEDTWICVDGEWVKHGAPSASKPTEPCGEEKSDLIRVDNPRPNQILTSPIKIEGEARGNWFFEASFPIELIDEQENILGTAIAQARGEWMTEDFVAFEARLEFSVPEETKATLIFKKDNPSGLPEYDDELRVLILLMPRI